MNKDVLITIKGLHETEDGNDSLESTSLGSYSYSDGVHVVRYDEAGGEDEVSMSIIHCVLFFSKKKVELHKLGDQETHMSFRLGETVETLYPTPYGDLKLEFATKAIDLTEEEDSISLKLNYELFMNGIAASDCTMSIIIKSR